MLSGINEICKKCRKKCKQFKQVVLVQCPKFQKLKKGGK